MENSDLTILRVQDPPKEKIKPLNPILPQPPSLLLMISPIRTGKSTIISNLLLNSQFYGPEIALVLDDIIGQIRRESYLNHLASRFRHYGIKLLLMSSQNYRSVSPVIRSNCTSMIIGSPFPNNKELGKIAEEIGDQFGGADNFLKIYHTATPEKYDFLYLDLQSNPPIAYHNFESIVAYGGQKADVETPLGAVNQSATPEIKSS